MLASVTALVWEIWRQKRWWFVVALAITGFGCVLNALLPDTNQTTHARDHVLLLNGFQVVAALLLIFGAFNYTTFNPQKEWTGFPYHLFTLPVTSLVLVTVPLVFGVVAVELIFVVWVKFVFTFREQMSGTWLAVLIGAYMVFYQTALWVLAGFRSVRVIALSLIGTSFIGIAFLPALGHYIDSPWLAERILIPVMIVLGGAAFLVAWAGIVRQRFGGGRRTNLFRIVTDWLTDRIPRRKREFPSRLSARFWFEWRRSGQLLPLCVGTIVVLVILPLSLHQRNAPESSMWILGWTFVTPILLAVPIGKGFSKPDFWASQLTVPSFLATQPLTNGEWVIIKMKVAALAASLSWAIVIAFLSLWLTLWANLESLAMVRIGLWMVYGHTMFIQYALAALTIFAAALVTWKFLVNGLCVGLSGRKSWFVGTATFYAAVWLGGMIILNILDTDHRAREARFDPDPVVAALTWFMAVAVAGKFWLAARSWRHIGTARVRQYLLLWTLTTTILVAGVMMMWADGTLSALLMAVLDFPPIDSVRLTSVLILGAALVIPFGRLGLAPPALANNRHGGPAQRRAEGGGSDE